MLALEGYNDQWGALRDDRMSTMVKKSGLWEGDEIYGNHPDKKYDKS